MISCNIFQCFQAKKIFMNLARFPFFYVVVLSVYLWSQELKFLSEYSHWNSCYSVFFEQIMIEFNIWLIFFVLVNNNFNIWLGCMILDRFQENGSKYVFVFSIVDNLCKLKFWLLWPFWKKKSPQVNSTAASWIFSELSSNTSECRR